MDITVIGVPFNSDGSSRGVARMPAALRDAGLVGQLNAAGHGVVDGGDVTFSEPVAARDPSSGIIALDSIVEIFAQVRERVAATMRSGRFPLVVAGECSVLLGSLAATRDAHGGVGLVFVDGHEDVWPPKSSPTGEVSDMELGLALGRHSHDVPAALGSELPLIGVESVVALGPRDYKEMEDAGVSSMRSELWFADDRQVAKATTETMARALSHLEPVCDALWLHVDLDVLSTDALPAVDYRQPGGLSWEQLERITELALGDRRVVGADVTIFNPDLDPVGEHARRIVQYLGNALTRTEES